MPRCKENQSACHYIFIATFRQLAVPCSDDSGRVYESSYCCLAHDISYNIITLIMKYNLGRCMLTMHTEQRKLMWQVLNCRDNHREIVGTIKKHRIFYSWSTTTKRLSRPIMALTDLPHSWLHRNDSLCANWQICICNTLQMIGCHLQAHLLMLLTIINNSLKKQQFHPKLFLFHAWELIFRHSFVKSCGKNDAWA